MARKKGPRLYLRNDRAGEKCWIIRDLTGDTRTGFGEEQEAEAKAMLDHYVSGQFVSKFKSDRGLIYFVTCLNSPSYPVKIGYSSTSAEARMINIQIGNPNLLNVIATQPGSIADEARLHTRFAHLRIRGEWFARSQEMMDYIGALPWKGTVFGAEEFDPERTLVRRTSPTELNSTESERNAG